MGRRALDWEDMFSGSGKNAFDAEFDAERGLEPPSPAILPPSPQDWDEAERAIRKRVEEFSDEALGVAEEWDGEFAHRSELWGPESARQQMRDRAAQHLFDAAHKSISGASRADFQRARERVAEERRVTGELWARFRHRHPDLSGVQPGVVEQAALRVLAAEAAGDPDINVIEHMAQHPNRIVDDVAAELHGGVIETDEFDQAAGRTNVGGPGAGYVPQGPSEAEPSADISGDLGRWQRSAGLF